MATTSPITPQSPSPRNPLAFWTETPLYLRILGGLILGAIVGMLLPIAFSQPYNASADSQSWGQVIAADFAIPSKLVLRLLGALAPPLILVVIIRALVTTEISGKTSGKLFGMLVLNTVVAILIGLAVANIVRPGQFENLKPPENREKIVEKEKQDPIGQLLDNVPKSIGGPFADDGKVIGVIFFAVVFGLALRVHRKNEVLLQILDMGTDVIIKVLTWVIELVPIAVFGIVASIVGTQGFSPFQSLALFILAVLLALFLQACYYLLRVRFWSWVRPFTLLKGVRDALIMAFSTASSTITMPVLFDRLKKPVGLREESASLGALVGSNFNNDGTALYEAMAALFIAQMIGLDLSVWQQLIVVLMSIVASVGAAGIPEAGLVTMILVFRSVGLPTEYILVLLPVDWFLDRARTMINIMGDMSVSCVLDGKTRMPEPVAGNVIALKKSG